MSIVETEIYYSRNVVGLASIGHEQRLFQTKKCLNASHIVLFQVAGLSIGEKVCVVFRFQSLHHHHIVKSFKT